MKTIKEYAKHTGLSSVTIYNWVRKGGLKTNGKGRILDGQTIPEKKGRGRAKQAQRTLGIVKQYDNDFNLITSYETSVLASEAVGTSRSNISFALRHPKRRAKGFFWRREDLY